MIKVTPRSAGLSPLQTGELKKIKDTQTNKLDNKKEKFDSISISQTEKPVLDDSQFINALKAQISAEVQKGSSEYKLSDLSRQVALGEYDINPADIARKIMAGGGEG